MLHGQRLFTLAVYALLLLGGTFLSLPDGPAIAAESSGSIWGADYFPNVTLTTHEGKKVRFFTDVIKGKIVALNFIYTNCPDACALETARLREVQRILGDRVGKDVFLYSITIDPEHDTPKVLREYAKKFQIGPGWLFLTGKDADIKLIREKLGLYSPEEGDNIKDHNLSFIIGNQATGQWMKMSPFENPYVLAEQLGSWLSNWKMPPKEKRNYAEAPEVRNISKGEELFRTRCASCHPIGMTEAERAEKRPLGPDLLGVTHKRDRAWLLRWMKDPSKMLKEKDPLATSLLAEYHNLPMPNLGLSDIEIQDVLAYIDEESHRLGFKHQ